MKASWGVVGNVVRSRGSKGPLSDGRILSSSLAVFSEAVISDECGGARELIQ